MLDVKYSLLNLLGHTDDSSLENLTGKHTGIRLIIQILAFARAYIIYRSLARIQLLYIPPMTKYSGYISAVIFPLCFTLVDVYEEYKQGSIYVILAFNQIGIMTVRGVLQYSYFIEFIT